jgi:hypothetical protein
VFTVFNASPLRLLWVTFPEAMQRSLSFVGQQHGLAMVIGRAVMVIAWQVAGWWIVVDCFRRGPAAARGTEPSWGGAAPDPARIEMGSSRATVSPATQNRPAADSLVPWS